jgi:hypothetical protein
MRHAIFFFFATVPSRFSFKTTGLHAIGFVQWLWQWQQQLMDLLHSRGCHQPLREYS